jgi:hypothetical protein
MTKSDFESESDSESSSSDEAFQKKRVAKRPTEKAKKKRVMTPKIPG